MRTMNLYKLIGCFILLSCVILHVHASDSSVSGDSPPDTFFPHVKFSSLDQMIRRIEHDRENDTFWRDSMGRYLRDVETVYLPEFLTDFSQIESVIVTPSYFCITVEIEDVPYQFGYYHSGNGAYTYDLAKVSYENPDSHKKYRPAMRLVDGHVVYYEYIYPFFRSEYVWMQDGVCCYLQVPGDMSEADFSLCKSVPFQLWQDAQAQDGQAAASPAPPSSEEPLDPLCPYVEFASLDEMSRRIGQDRAANAFQPDGLGNYLRDVKTIYLPESLTDYSSIKSVVATPTYFYVTFDKNEALHRFGYYHSGKGETSFAVARGFLDKEAFKKIIRRKNGWLRAMKFTTQKY